MSPISTPYDNYRKQFFHGYIALNVIAVSSLVAGCDQRHTTSSASSMINVTVSCCLKYQIHSVLAWLILNIRLCKHAGTHTVFLQVVISTLNALLRRGYHLYFSFLANLDAKSITRFALETVDCQSASTSYCVPFAYGFAQLDTFPVFITKDDRPAKGLATLWDSRYRRRNEGLERSQSKPCPVALPHLFWHWHVCV